MHTSIVNIYFVKKTKHAYNVGIHFMQVGRHTDSFSCPLLQMANGMPKATLLNYISTQQRQNPWHDFIYQSKFVNKEPDQKYHQ